MARPAGKSSMLQKNRVQIRRRSERRVQAQNTVAHTVNIMMSGLMVRKVRVLTDPDSSRKKLQRR